MADEEIDVEELEELKDAPDEEGSPRKEPEARSAHSSPSDFDSPHDSEPEQRVQHAVAATTVSPGKPARPNPFLSSPAAAVPISDEESSSEGESANAPPAKRALSPDDPSVRRPASPEPGASSSSADEPSPGAQSGRSGSEPREKHAASSSVHAQPAGGGSSGQAPAPASGSQARAPAQAVEPRRGSGSSEARATSKATETRPAASSSEARAASSSDARAATRGSEPRPAASSGEQRGTMQSTEPRPAASGSEAQAQPRPRSPLFAASDEGRPRAPSPVSRAVAAAAAALATARAAVERREPTAAAAVRAAARPATAPAPAPASPGSGSVAPLSFSPSRMAIVPAAPAGALALPSQPIQGDIDECTFTLRKSREELQRIIGEARSLIRGASERNRGLSPSLPSIAPYRRVSPPRLAPTRPVPAPVPAPAAVRPAPAATRSPDRPAPATAPRAPEAPAPAPALAPSSRGVHPQSRARSPTAEAIAAAKATIASRPRSPSPTRRAAAAAVAAAAARHGSRTPSPTRRASVNAETSPDRPSVQVGKVRVSTAAESRVHIEEFEEPSGGYRAQITVVEKQKSSPQRRTSPPKRAASPPKRTASPPRRPSSPALASSSSFVPLAAAPSPAATALGFHPQARPKPRPAPEAAPPPVAPAPRRPQVDRGVQAEPPAPPPRPPSPTPSEAPSEFERRLYDFERDKWLARVQEAEARHAWELDEARQLAAAELERVRRECDERLSAKDRICASHCAELESLRGEREGLAEASDAARSELGRLSTQFMSETAETDSLRATVARLREELALVSRVNLELEGQHRRDVREAVTGMPAGSDEEEGDEEEEEGPLSFLRPLRTTLLDWLGRAHADVEWDLEQLLAIADALRATKSARLAPAVAERVLRLAEALATAALHESGEAGFPPRRPLRHALARLRAAGPAADPFCSVAREAAESAAAFPRLETARGVPPPSALASLRALCALVPALLSSAHALIHRALLPALGPPAAPGPPPVHVQPDLAAPEHVRRGPRALERVAGLRVCAGPPGPPPRAWVDLLRECDARRLDLRPFAALFAALDRAAANAACGSEPPRAGRRRQQIGFLGPASAAAAPAASPPPPAPLLRAAAGPAVPAAIAYEWRPAEGPLQAPGPGEVRRLAEALPGAEFAGYEDRPEGGAGVLLFRAADLSITLAAALAAATSFAPSPSPPRRRPRRRAASSSPPAAERAARLARAGAAAVKLSCLRYAMERCFKHSCPYRGERWHLYTPFKPYALVIGGAAPGGGAGEWRPLQGPWERREALAMYGDMRARLAAAGAAAGVPAGVRRALEEGVLEVLDAAQESGRPYHAALAAAARPLLRALCAHALEAAQPGVPASGLPLHGLIASLHAARADLGVLAVLTTLAQLCERLQRAPAAEEEAEEGEEAGECPREPPLTEDERGDGALTLLAALADAIAIAAAAPPPTPPPPPVPRLPLPASPGHGPPTSPGL